MSDAISFDGVLYVSTIEAAQQAGLSSDYVSQLARQGVVRAKRAGRKWYVEPDSLGRFLTEQVSLKVKRSAELSNELRRVAVQAAAATPKHATAPETRPASGSSQLFQWFVAAPLAVLLAGGFSLAAFGLSHQLSNPTADATSRSQAASAAAATSGETPAATSAKTSLQQTSATSSPKSEFANAATSRSNPTVIDQYITSPVERVVESEPLAVENFVTQDELNSQLLQLSDSLSQKFSASAPPSVPQNVAADGNVTAYAPIVPAINNLSNVTISNPTFSGVTTSQVPEGSNLYYTDARVAALLGSSASTTFGNGINVTTGCFAVDGTCITGGGAGGASLSAANTWTALQLFSAGASTTNFSNFGTAYFGGTATTTIDSSGNLTVAGNTTLQNATTTSLFAKSQLSASNATLGVATVGALTATSSLAVSGTSAFTGLATFGSASTSIFSAYGPSYFGGTATSSFNSSGQLTLANLASSVLAVNGSGAVGATSTPTAASFNATSTTATSTFAGGVSVSALNVTSSTASSTFANGIALTSGCVAVNGICLGATSASSTLLSDNNIWSGNALFSASTTFTKVANFANASSTLNTFATVWLPNVSTGSLLKVNSSGQVAAAVAGTDYVAPSGLAAAYPFGINGNATSTLTQFNGGLTAFASSTIGNGTQTGGLTINGGATTTGAAYFSGATTTFAKGIVAPCFSNDGVTCITGTGGGGGITEITAGTGLTGGIITTSGTIALDLTHANTWTALQLFSANASSTNFSNFGTAYFGGTATSSFDSAGDLTLNGSLTANGATTLSNATTTSLFVKSALSASAANFGATATSTFASNGALTTPAITDLGASSFANSDNFFGLTSFGGTGTTTVAANGTISTPSITATSTTAQTATAYNATIGALTATNTLAVYNSASFGAIATSSFNSAGQLTLASALSIGNGGTGTSTPASYGNLLSWTGSNYQAIATSTLGLAISSFASHNISQWTNDAGYLTSLAGAASSTLLADNNTFSGNDTFNNTITGSVSGNAGTATALQNARTINNVSFNGTSNITINAASSTALSDNNIWSGNALFNASTTFTKVANFANASSTLVTLGTVWLPNITAGSLLYANSAGQVAAASATYPVQFSGGALSLAFGTTTSNTFAGTQTFSNISATNATTSTLYVTGVTSHLLKTDSNGQVVAATAGTDYQAAGNYLTALGNYSTTTGTTISISTSTLSWNGLTLGNTFAVSANGITVAPTVLGTISNSGLTNSTISGVSLGGTLASFSAGSGLSGSAYNGSGAQTFSLNLGNANNWTGLQTFANASSSLFSAYGPAYFGATATSSFSSAGQLTLANLASALLAVNASGQVVATSTIGANLVTGTLGVGNGGTGIASTPSYGQLLVGNGITYTLTATSSLGLPTFANLTSQIGAAYPFQLTGNATSTLTQFNGGLTAYASSTIGNGTQAGGLTINGGATTTGNIIGQGNLALTGTLSAQAATLTGTSGTSTIASGQGFTIGGSQFVVQQGSGNVGIGTTNPGALLEVNGTAAIDGELTASAGTNALRIDGAGGSWFWIDNPNSSTLRFSSGSTAGTNPMVFNSSGDLGIGTTNPAEVLHVYGSSGAPSGVSSTTGLAWFEESSGGNGINLGFNNSGSPRYGWLQSMYEGANGTVYNLSLNPLGGNVGIGTTSPATTLSVSGNGYLTGGLGVGLLNTTAGTIQSSGNILGNGTLALTGTTGTTTIASGQGFTIGGSQFVVQQGSGSVGIGTTSPATTLDVNGNVTDESQTNCSGVKTTATGELLCTSSDERIKQDIEPLDATSSLAAIDALQPVSFLYKDPLQGTGTQLGFLAQQVQPIFPGLVATSSETTPWTPNGTLTLNYDGLIAPLVEAVQNIANISSSFETNLIAWLGSAENGITKLFAGEVDTQRLCVNDGPNDPNPICLTKSQLVALLSQTASSQPPESASSLAPQNSSSTLSESVSSTTSTTPPVIQINGDNPAIIQVGSIYTDLGATITGPQQDLNLGMQTFVNGVAMSPVQIDTTQAATDTIDYVATDQSGLTSTSTRTVLIEAAAAPSIVPTDDASTTQATSTPQ